MHDLARTYTHSGPPGVNMQGHPWGYPAAPRKVAAGEAIAFYIDEQPMHLSTLLNAMQAKAWTGEGGGARRALDGFACGPERPQACSRRGRLRSARLTRGRASESSGLPLMKTGRPSRGLGPGFGLALLPKVDHARVVQVVRKAGYDCCHCRRGSQHKAALAAATGCVHDVFCDYCTPIVTHITACGMCCSLMHAQVLRMPYVVLHLVALGCTGSPVINTAGFGTASGPSLRSPYA